VGGKVEIMVVDAGEQRLKNIDRPLQCAAVGRVAPKPFRGGHSIKPCVEARSHSVR
jgi:hypothetical protein